MHCHRQTLFGIRASAIARAEKIAIVFANGAKVVQVRKFVKWFDFSLFLPPELSKRKSNKSVFGESGSTFSYIALLSLLQALFLSQVGSLPGSNRYYRRRTEGGRGGPQIFLISGDGGGGGDCLSSRAATSEPGLQFLPQENGERRGRRTIPVTGVTRSQCISVSWPSVP